MILLFYNNIIYIYIYIFINCNYCSKITPNYRINFENKVRQLRSQKNMEIGNSETQIYINRANLFNDAFDNIMNKSPIELKNRIKIIYAGETGVDAGGLLRLICFI